MTINEFLRKYNIDERRDRTAPDVTRLLLTMGATASITDRDLIRFHYRAELYQKRLREALADMQRIILAIMTDLDQVTE
jgi:hypothetical protein